MAMGKKKRRQQEDLWVATSELPRTAGHPFYERLNGLFNEHGFDDFVEGLCAKFYADKMGRPSLAPGVALLHGSGRRWNSPFPKR